jgi:hypothetical protein
MIARFGSVSTAILAFAFVPDRRNPWHRRLSVLMDNRQAVNNVSASQEVTAQFHARHRFFT